MDDAPDSPPSQDSEPAPPTWSRRTCLSAMLALGAAAVHAMQGTHPLLDEILGSCSSPASAAPNPRPSPSSAPGAARSVRPPRKGASAHPPVPQEGQRLLPPGVPPPPGQTPTSPSQRPPQEQERPNPAGGIVPARLNAAPKAPAKQRP